MKPNLTPKQRLQLINVITEVNPTALAKTPTDASLINTAMLTINFQNIRIKSLKNCLEAKK